MRVAGSSAVITGASAGVGRATAARLARAGASVGLVGRDAKALEETRSEIASLGGVAYVAPADVADPDGLFAAAEFLAEKQGPPDLWINNAMLTVFSPVSEITPAEFRRVTEVTYLGAVHGTMAALRQMRPRGTGAIIQVGSALAYRGIPLQAAYCGAKHALRGFTNSLRCELIHEGSRITLTMVQLPAVNTPQFDWARTHRSHQPRPVAPVVQPEAVAEAILAAAERPSRERWLGLSTAKVVLGSMVAPAWLDRYLARNAFEAQDRPERVTADRPDNLEAPVHALHRARGAFGREAAPRVASWSGSEVRATLAGVALAGLAAAVGLASRRRRASR